MITTPYMAHQFQEDVVKVLDKKRYEKLDVDDILIIFGRIHTALLMSKWQKKKKIQIKYLPTKLPKGKKWDYKLNKWVKK